ncbi:uncharacterized protein EI90DRAFT_3089514 [Cantharellus anzutake]|uniref:uncharacterized protein n=1 Tax=Cantharellus anzutake TaxID=1750568 RepID=UPI001905D9B6|nr:uncharacterized protein EI90DRAFT_3089514 [Cantharellus anzutake]KAF8314814.1 hypothetical protein EI90DRAFT_3089514 [Cantharellus anzutake]
MTIMYSISNTAYIKLILHAAKYPHATVNGVLLGSKSGNEVSVIDTIPLLHHWTSLSPMMEIGLDLARSSAEERQLQLVGYYQATNRPNDKVLVPVGEKVASSIKTAFPDAFALVIDGTSLDGSNPALIPHVFNSSASSWKPQSPLTSASSPFKLQNTSSPSLAFKYIHEGVHRQFGDFDDHLEDVTIDWLRNAPVSYVIEA